MFNLCGLPSVRPSINAKNSNRIIAGYSAKPHSWPWIVSIRFNNGTSKNHICSGSLIKSQYVLTAANCVNKINISQLSVVAGSHTLDIVLNSLNNFDVLEVYLHPNFSSNGVSDNIAIIKLQKPLNETRKILRICLPPNGDETYAYKKNVFVAGWGSTTGIGNRESMSNEIHQAQLKVINKEPACKRYDSFVYCVRDPERKKSNICYGDAGNPLMIVKKNKWYLYGIASFVTVNINNLTCINTEPSYFTIVPRYLKWIEPTITNNKKKKKT
ncbi:unnamed protein product [Brachionus calyciflorus]|uniref:Peptidase S1 domain-containing protein n=1 Tax=Brachionus calyciflorus TaxID=104777 RepID=A0A813WZH5_9BILA|nr:unnamed protein product [Brachionus calyciflorus]